MAFLPLDPLAGKAQIENSYADTHSLSRHWNRGRPSGRRIVERTLSDFPEDALFVVYCGGPHCNGADRAAVQLSRLGRKVKKMLGGIHGWHVEGFATSAGER